MFPRSRGSRRLRPAASVLGSARNASAGALIGLGLVLIGLVVAVNAPA